MTDSERLLNALRSGPKRASDLYRLGLMVHSRASDLRRKGHIISVTRVEGKGAAGYVYRLERDAAEPEQLRLSA